MPKHKRGMMRGLFGGQNLVGSTPLPQVDANASPWYYTGGPVFYPGGAGAVLHSKLSFPWQTIFGYAYRVANPNRFNVLQPEQAYAPKGVPIVGINIQTGWTPITSPSVNSDGTYVSDGGFYGDPTSGFDAMAGGDS
jgi:hypothetical protein